MRYSTYSISSVLLVITLVLGSCADVPSQEQTIPSEVPGTHPGGKTDTALTYLQKSPQAADSIIYEVQVRSANACRTDVGTAWQREACAEKVAPQISYRAEGMRCHEQDYLDGIKLGTIDDMLEDTTDYRAGITVHYIAQRVGANTLWLMPVFPNNDMFDIPDACDNLGSPYAVRDYMHVRGSLARTCIVAGKDEYSEVPCWGDEQLEELIAEAASHGVTVMLDLAFNHFGHNYLLYDYTDFHPVRERIAAGQDLNSLGNFSSTYDPGLLYPEVLETPEQLQQLAQDDPQHRGSLDALLSRCPELTGQSLVVGYNMWRIALDWEREQFNCDVPYLEYSLPGFYLGSDHFNPSSRLGDNFTNDWRDVKFLYHQINNIAHAHEYTRNREYLFRVMNYWVSRGVGGFRLDHTTDYFSGLSPDEWIYIISKVNYYAAKRGQARPIFLAEEFHDQMGMDRVVDIMTEGYVRDMTGRDGIEKDAAHVESVLDNASRFPGGTLVMTALETHDEHRLLDGTGFNIWTGVGFWGLGATIRSTPMLLMGQEFGASWGLAFRKSEFIRSRFVGTEQYTEQGDVLVDTYGAINHGRSSDDNRALLSRNQWALRTKSGNAIDPRVVAMAKWSNDGNVVFVLHNLWEQHVVQHYYLPPQLAAQLDIEADTSYKLVDVFSNVQLGSCHSGADLAWDFYVELDRYTRFQWLRLETCR